MNTPLISIFIPYYNDEKFLKQSIESILNNDYQNFELILLNHATTDSSREIAHSYKDTRIKHIDMDINYGGGSGILFEKMLSIAKGKYIKPFCADDVLKKDGLTILVDYMENNPNKDFAFGDVEYVDEKADRLEMSWNKDHNRVFRLDNNEVDCLKLYARGISFLPFPASIIKKTAIDDILPVNQTWIMVFDMSLWVMLLCKGYKIGLIDTIVAYYRLHKGQVSSIYAKKRVYALSRNESESFTHLFLSINSISLAKQVFSGWGDDRFDDIISDKQDLDFYIAYKFFVATNKIYPYVLIDRMLNDDTKRQRIEKVFGYTIKDFREDIVANNTNTKHKKSSFKRKIYDKSTKDLNLFDLCFLGGRWILLMIKGIFKTIKQFIKRLILQNKIFDLPKL